VCGCVEYLCAIGYNCLTKWVRSPLVCAPKMCHTSLNAHTWPEGRSGLGSVQRILWMGSRTEWNNNNYGKHSQTPTASPSPSHFASKRISTPILVEMGELCIS